MNRGVQIDASVSSEQRVGPVSAAMDDLPALPFHRDLFGRVAFGMFFDVFDLYIAAAVAGALVATGWATIAQIGPLTSLTLAGMLLGGLCAGIVGDRLGRRSAFRWSLAVVGVSSLVAAAAPSVGVLTAARFVTGLGVGAEAVLGYAAFGEYLPRAIRARWLSRVATVANLGVVAAALAGYFLIPSVGWRSLFIIGAAGAFFGWYVRRTILESPRWLEARGRHAEALAAFFAIAPDRARAIDARVHSAEVVTTHTSAADANSDLARSLVVAAVMNAALYVAIFSFLTWLPSIMVAEGRALPRSLLMNVFMSCGALIGTLSAGYVSELGGRRMTVAVLAGLAAVLGLAFAAFDSPLAQTITGFSMYVAIYALAVVSVSIYAPELFSTAVRLRGAGTAVAIGRACAMLAPLALPSVLAAYGLLGVTIALASILCIEIGVVLSLGVETKHRLLR